MRVTRYILARNRSSAFTLTELIVVMLLLGIVATIAAPRFTESVHRFRAESSAKRIMMDLNMARRRAMIMGKAVEVTFSPSTHSYSIPQVSSLNSITQTFQVSLSVSPYQSTLNSVSFPGGTGGDLQVIFNHYGSPDSGGSVIVHCGTINKTVQLNANTGEATIL